MTDITASNIDNKQGNQTDGYNHSKYRQRDWYPCTYMYGPPCHQSKINYLYRIFSTIDPFAFFCREVLLFYKSYLTEVYTTDACSYNKRVYTCIYIYWKKTPKTGSLYIGSTLVYRKSVEFVTGPLPGLSLSCDA